MLWFPLQAPGGYGAALLQAFVALIVVCVLAWVVLRAVAGRGMLGGRGRIQVLERTFLDAKRALYLVRVGDRVFLLGSGDRAAPALLAELDPDDVSVPEAKSKEGWLTAFRGAPPEAPSGSSDSEGEESDATEPAAPDSTAADESRVTG